MKNNSSTNPFSTKFWTAGKIPYQFDEENNTVADLLKQRKASITQIIEAHGSGKSTLLQAIVRYNTEQQIPVRLEILNDQKRRLPNDFVPYRSNRNTLFLLDGFEQLSFSERFWLRMQQWNLTGGLVLTTHRQAIGIPVLYRTISRFEILLKLVLILLQNQRKENQPKLQQFIPDEKMLHELFTRSGGNFRTAFFELYDLFQSEN